MFMLCNQDMFNSDILLITFRAHSSTTFHGMFSFCLSAINCEQKDEKNETVDIFGKNTKEKAKKKDVNPMIFLDGLVEKVLSKTYAMMSVSWKTIQRGECFPI